jgi:DNA topoisomerase-3
MQDIAEMTARMVKKAKEYDRDTIPGDYATLTTPCPTCAGVVKENYRRYTCIGKAGAVATTNADGEIEGPGCGFSFGKTPAGLSISGWWPRAHPWRAAEIRSQSWECA